jgi:hypothetical protein
MKSSLPIFLLVASAVLLVTPTFADDVTGKDKMICTSVRATECFADGECVPGSPENWNLPRFTKVDLEKMTLSTTEASGENRTTPIDRVETDGDDILAHGAQGGRAFSFVLDQDSGTATVAVALEGSVLAVFSVCTPME